MKVEMTMEEYKRLAMAADDWVDCMKLVYKLENDYITEETFDIKGIREVMKEFALLKKTIMRRN